MRRTVLIATLPLALACYGTPEPPTEPTHNAPDTLRVVGGQVLCDGCNGASFDLAGPGLDGVSGGAFLARDGTGRRLSDGVEFRRFTGDSGVVLQAHVTFSDTVRIGEYDLRLQTPGRNLPTEALTIAKALRVTKLWLPPAGGTTTPPPPPPPGGPGNPPPGSGAVLVSVTVSGIDPDPLFLVHYDYSDYYGYSAQLSATAPVLWNLPAGPHTISLDDVQSNCVVQGGPTHPVVVVQDDTVSVPFAVTCSQIARIRVTATFSGERPQYVPVSCDDNSCWGAALDADGVAVLIVREGEHSLRLSLPLNCTVNGANPLAVTAIAGAEVPANFSVTCSPTTATARIIVRATGANVDSSFTVLAGKTLYAGCENSYYYDCTVLTLAPYAAVGLTVFPGTWQFLLRDIAPNCSVITGNPQQREIVAGTTASVVFDVTCN